MVKDGAFSQTMFGNKSATKVQHAQLFNSQLSYLYAQQIVGAQHTCTIATFVIVAQFPCIFLLLCIVHLTFLLYMFLQVMPLQCTMIIKEDLTKKTPKSPK